MNIVVTRGGGTVVNNLRHQPKVKDSSPGATGGIGKQKLVLLEMFVIHKHASLLFQNVDYEQKLFILSARAPL
jgi:hypothetical protein